MKKRNFIFTGIIALALVASLSFAVYAALSTSFNISNKISFVAEGVYYKVSAKVYYENNPSELIAEYNHLDDDPISGESEWVIEDDIEFAYDKRVIIYEITIENHTESDITASLTGFLEDNVDDGIDKFDYITNVVMDGASAGNIITKYTDGQPASAVTLVLKTTVKSLANNFSFDNSFGVELNLVD